MFLISEEYIAIKETTDRGRGVFAKKNITAGTIIGDYIGKVISIDDEHHYDNDSTLFLMQFSDTASLYPDPAKPGIHITNHFCIPNCWFYDYNGRILCFSLRTIFPGEELTIDYLLDPINNHCAPCEHICKCGEVLCRGTWHMNETKAKKMWAYWKEQEALHEKPLYEIGKDLPLLEAYPHSIDDNPLFNLFGNRQVPQHVVETTSVPSLSEIRKILRETGKTIHLPSLHLLILGVQDDMIVTQQLP